MQIKRFEAKDMTSALRLIKKELGADAVILSARNLKKENKIIGRIKSMGVEVTAAVDGYHPPAALEPAISAGAINSYRRNQGISVGSPQKVNFRKSVGRRIKTLYGRKRPHLSSNGSESGDNDLLADVFQYLLSQEVKRDIANDIVDALTAEYPVARPFDTTGQVTAAISKILENKRNGAEKPHLTKSCCRVLAVAGPTGVGKTTTIAKLAARYAIEHHKNVALISLDSDRIGGRADLKVYAKAIGVPIKTAATPSDFKSIVDGLREFDIVLVDTSGFNPNKDDQIDDLIAYLSAVDGIETHLALSTVAKEGDLLNTLKYLNRLNVQHLIFTKIDESCTYGNLINVLIRHALPVSFVTDGRDVPHAIEAGSMRKIVEHLMSSFPSRNALLNSEKVEQSPSDAAGHIDGNAFVANKNSDVFHRSDCKWTQKIKSKHTISFATAHAAQLAKFMPCQDCQPANSRPLKVGLQARDSVRFSTTLNVWDMEGS